MPVAAKGEKWYNIKGDVPINPLISPSCQAGAFSGTLPLRDMGCSSKRGEMVMASRRLGISEASGTPVRAVGRATVGPYAGQTVYYGPRLTGAANNRSYRMGYFVMGETANGRAAVSNLGRRVKVSASGSTGG